MDLTSITTTLTGAATSLGSTAATVAAAGVGVGLTVFGIIKAVRWFKRSVS